MSKNKYFISTGHMVDDGNLRQAFSMTEDGLAGLDAMIIEQGEVVDKFKEDIASHLIISMSELAAIEAALDTSTSSLADTITAVKKTINALTELSKKLKEL